MKMIVLNGLLAVALLAVLLLLSAKLPSQPHYSSKTSQSMKFNVGIITPSLQESKAFYTKLLGFGVTFENEWFVLLHSPDGSNSLAFMLPDQSAQAPLFRPSFGGKGVFITVEVPEVDLEYDRIKALGVPIAVDLRDEPWGERHFAIVDPNGIGVDIVTYRSPENE